MVSWLRITPQSRSQAGNTAGHWATGLTIARSARGRIQMLHGLRHRSKTKQAKIGPCSLRLRPRSKLSDKPGLNRVLTTQSGGKRPNPARPNLHPMSTFTRQPSDEPTRVGLTSRSCDLATLRRIQRPVLNQSTIFRTFSGQTLWINATHHAASAIIRRYLIPYLTYCRTVPPKCCVDSPRALSLPKGPKTVK